MGLVNERANDARQLLNDRVFKDICAEIRDDAVSLFLDPTSSIDTLSIAHSRIRAVETFLNAIKIRLDDELIADKTEKAKHRE